MAHFDQRLDGGQPCSRCEIDVGADRGAAVGGEQAGRTLGAFDGVGEGDGVAGQLHGHDRAEEIAGGILDALGQEGLVEMGVRFGERR